MQMKRGELRMVGAIIGGILAIIIVIGLTIWITKKAYSRKWEEDDTD